ncbi:MAG: hypothetical protein AB3A66_05995 [Nodularia sp. CChRGM 3473]
MNGEIASYDNTLFGIQKLSASGKRSHFAALRSQFIKIQVLSAYHL